MSDMERLVRDRFERETAEHELTIIRDDGLYRHLRCQAPGTWTYGFDIVTWPGYLAIVGDAGDFVFSRIRDMFKFFESDSGRINPDYWSQKLQAPRGTRSVERHSGEVARKRIDEWAADIAQEMEDDYLEFDEQGPAGGRAGFEFWRELHSELFYVEMEDEHAVFEFLRDLEIGSVRCGDWWEWTFPEWDWQFLWCCHAIVWAIGKYRAATREPMPA